MGIFKDKATILTILFNNPAYVSGQVLADFNNTGLKTLRKEIDLLNEYCRDYGFEVISKVGIGYMLDIKDNEKYQSFRNYVESKFYNGYYYDNAQHERVHYLTRLLLVKNAILSQMRLW